MFQASVWSNGGKYLGKSPKNSLQKILNLPSQSRFRLQPLLGNKGVILKSREDKEDLAKDKKQRNRKI